MHCPAGVGGNAADGPPDVQMSAADVDYVTDWEQKTGIKLELAFNAIGACTAPSATTTSGANCAGSTTENGTTYTDPGQTVDSGYPDDSAFVNELLGNQSSFNWITHTWSHMFLGCTVAQPLPMTAVTAGSAGVAGGRRLQLRGHRGHRVRRVRALRRPAGHRGRGRLGRALLAGRPNGGGTDPVQAGVGVLRRHRLLGLQRLPRARRFDRASA